MKNFFRLVDNMKNYFSYWFPQISLSCEVAIVIKHEKDISLTNKKKKECCQKKKKYNEAPQMKLLETLLFIDEHFGHIHTLKDGSNVCILPS